MAQHWYSRRPTKGPGVKAHYWLAFNSPLIVSFLIAHQWPAINGPFTANIICASIAVNGWPIDGTYAMGQQYYQLKAH